MQKRKNDLPQIRWPRVMILTFLAFITGIALLGFVVAMVSDSEPNQSALMAEFERQNQIAEPQMATPSMAATNGTVATLIAQMYAAETTQVMATGTQAP